MNTLNTNINSASVKVMRSHDYCHFEVILGTSDVPLDSIAIDDLRKEAARLADKSVEQYKTAKVAKERYDQFDTKWRYKQALEIPENERNPEAKAIIKFHEDAAFRSQFEYDYEDDWEPPGY